MLATSTHDTKRSEDVRARISLLSEMPEKWKAAVNAWAAHNERHKTGGWPDRNTEYFFYQTLLGAWPISNERLQAYMQKAIREAKTHTSWTNNNADFETAVQKFIQNALNDQTFMDSFARFTAPLIEPGRVQALSQVLIKLMAPGVPDLYQGTEIWDLSLVDPDNRRPVDYALRRRLLAELDGLTPEEILSRSDDGLPKLWTIRQALRVREQLGDYEPVAVTGQKRKHAIAFRRGDLLCIAPRLVMGLGGDWGDTELNLPEASWRNELTGDACRAGRVRLTDLLHRFPAALLSRQ